jgi:NAD(P)-dependent dehydrogenase (short-subunit alcohol dehydrogenase family)
MIINVTSIGAVRGALGNGYYSAAKGALELASEALAKETEHLGIDVMLVEPGAMRTGFFDERLKETGVKIADYDAVAGRYRKESSVNHHDQSGSPEKGAAIIVETALREDRPFRLLLGSDAYAAAVTTLQERLNEAEKWADISHRMDYQKEDS